MTVRLSSHIRSYTKGRASVEAVGTTVGAVLADLDRRFPGIRFRIIDEQGAIRPHMRIFLNEDLVRELSVKVKSTDEVHLIGALSGG